MPPKQFKFRLETVLELRKKKEEQEQEKYLKLVDEVARMDRQIEEVRSEQHRIYRECAEKMADGVELNEWRREMGYANYLNEVAGRLVVHRGELEKARLCQRDVLIEATKKKKVLESLKGKAFQDFIFETNLQEQRELDDWASTHFRP